MSTNCPLSCGRPADVRQQDALHRIERRQTIRDRHADPGGSRLRKSGYVHHPRLPLDDNVVAGQITAGPGGAVAGNRAVNQSLVQRPRLLRPEAEPLERAGPKVFDDHVGRPNQLGQERLAFDRLQIDGDALLVAVDAEKIGAPAADERRPRRAYRRRAVGSSILITSAPMSPSSIVHSGPASTRVKSRTRSPVSGNSEPADSVMWRVTGVRPSATRDASRWSYSKPYLRILRQRRRSAQHAPEQRQTLRN